MKKNLIIMNLVIIFITNSKFDKIHSLYTITIFEKI